MFFHPTNCSPRFAACSFRRLEKANQQVITRSRTGNLPPPKPVVDASDMKVAAVSGKATPEEIKEKMEQQLRLQRAAHQQKRALEVKSINVKTGQAMEIIGSTATGKSKGIL